MKNSLVSCLFLVMLASFASSKDREQMQKQRSPIILKKSTLIFADLKIDAKSVGEVIATVTFRNTSAEDFLLYKPIVPNEGLMDNDFIIEDGKHKYLDHIKSHSDQRYYESDAYKLPRVVIPVLESQNFITLAPGKSISFAINIAKRYRFINKGPYRAIYNVFMPVVSRNLTQMSEMDPVDQKLKPIYLIIASGDTGPDGNQATAFKVIR